MAKTGRRTGCKTIPAADHAGQGFPPPINAEAIRAAEGRIIEAGREEGYPECCIAFFVEIWSPLMLSGIDRDSDTMGVVMGYRARVGAAGFGPGYIPCPACLRRAGERRGSIDGHFTTRRRSRDRGKRAT